METSTLFGSKRPATDPDKTAAAMDWKPQTPKLAFSVLDYENMEMWQSGRLRQTVNLFLTARWFESIRLHQTWFQSVHGRTPACHAGRRGSLPLETAKFLEATPPGHFLARALGPATVASPI